MPTARRPSRFRLPPDVRPSVYELHLEPNLEAGTFRGSVRIRVRLERARRELVLHAADLTIERAAIRVGTEDFAVRPRVSRAWPRSGFARDVAFLLINGPGVDAVIGSVLRVLAEYCGRGASLAAALAAPWIHTEGDRNVKLDPTMPEPVAAYLTEVGYATETDTGAAVSAVEYS